MIRTAAAFSALLVLAACDDAAEAPAPNPTVQPAGFDNGAAPRSIMQPEVIAESKPEPQPTPTATLPLTATILFDKGATLDDRARAMVDQLLARPALPTDARWILRGSSDTSGSNAANLRVSRLRAQAVATYLVSKGIDTARITVVALADGRPAAPNVTLDGSDDPEGRAKNRRVDITIVAPAPVPADAGQLPDNGSAPDNIAA